jgi:uncharacterized RDD family membrane protein YckC
MAGFWRRGLALGLDLAMVTAFVYVVLKIGPGPLDLGALPRSGLHGIDHFVHLLLQHSGKVFPILLFGAGTAFAYFVLCQAILAATPGKLMLGMRIVDARGRRIGPVRALLRTLAYGISASFFLMGFFWAAFDLERRSLHDVLSGTYVIVGKPEPSGVPAPAPGLRPEPAARS